MKRWNFLGQNLLTLGVLSKIANEQHARCSGRLRYCRLDYMIYCQWCRDACVSAHWKDWFFLRRLADVKRTCFRRSAASNLALQYRLRSKILEHKSIHSTSWCEKCREARLCRSRQDFMTLNAEKMD